MLRQDAQRYEEGGQDELKPVGHKETLPALADKSTADRTGPWGGSQRCTSPSLFSEGPILLPAWQYKVVSLYGNSEGFLLKKRVGGWGATNLLPGQLGAGGRPRNRERCAKGRSLRYDSERTGLAAGGTKAPVKAGRAFGRQA